MKIWVDADALPNAIKAIIVRAAEQRKIKTNFVANQPMRLKRSSFVNFMLVKPGENIADDEIVYGVESGDLVITADIPLAAQSVEKGALVLTPRGDILTHENVREKLSVRDFMQELRNAGIATTGPPAFGPRDKQKFANAFDRLLTRHVS